MKQRWIKSFAIIMAIMIIITSLPALAVSAATGSPSSSNWGTRDQVCTSFAGSDALAYYTGEYTYANLSTLSANDIKMLNIFLSNFSEAYVENIDTSDMEAMIDFVCLNTLINYRENINYTNAQDVINPENGHRYFSWISEEYVAERVDRFFDVELRNVSTESCYYYDGKYYYSGTDGDTYACFTKVTSATENTDGTITVEYDVYWYDGDTYDQPPSYAYEGIGSENLNGQFEYRYSGTAVVKPVQLGGEGYANYKLVSLERD